MFFASWDRMGSHTHAVKMVLTPAEEAHVKNKYILGNPPRAVVLQVFTG